MQVSVFCMTKYWAFQLADQLYKHNALGKLYTSFYGKFGKKQNNLGFEIPLDQVRTNLLFAFLSYGYNPFSDLFLWRNFGEWAVRYIENEDIVVSWGFAALPIIQKAKEIGALSIVERGSTHAAVQRDIVMEEFERYGLSTDELRRSFSAERMEHELLEYELADYITVPSEFAKRSFIDQGIPETKILRQAFGVDLKIFHETPKTDDVFRVIYTGQMSLRKGVHYLLRAFTELNLPNAELWLFGIKRPDIDRFFEQYKGHYKYFGHMPQHMLANYYAQGSMFAICSIEEGLALVQPQAMACGLPLLCTTNTGGEDIITDGVEGFVIPIRNVEAIKEKILYLYENQDICYEMGQAAKRKVTSYSSWDDYGRSTVSTYRTLLEGR